MINHVKDKNYSSVTSFKTKALDHSLMTDGCGSVLAIFYCPIDLNLVLSLSPSQYLWQIDYLNQHQHPHFHEGFNLYRHTLYTPYKPHVLRSHAPYLYTGPLDSWVALHQSFFLHLFMPYASPLYLVTCKEATPLHWIYYTGPLDPLQDLTTQKVKVAKKKWNIKYCFFMIYNHMEWKENGLMRNKGFFSFKSR